MRIAICGSMSFIEGMRALAGDLKDLGHKVVLPKDNESSVEAKIKNDYISYYFKEIQKSDAILVFNLEKNCVSGYIGPNTFLEMGFAHVLDKRIFLFKSLPLVSPYIDEIQAMQPIVMDGDLAKLAEYDRELYQHQKADFKNLSNAEIAKHRYMIEKALEETLALADSVSSQRNLLYTRWRALMAECKHEKINGSPFGPDDGAECAYCAQDM